MVKIVGSVLILAGGVLAWQAQLSERRRRMDTLLDLLTALRRMAEEIRIARTPLPSLLQGLAALCRSDAAIVFSTGAAALRSGQGLSVVWRQSVAALGLSPGARGALNVLGDDLHGDEESVCKAISLAIKELEKSREELENSRQTEEKRTTALCFSAAALLVILLI